MKKKTTNHIRILFMKEKHPSPMPGKQAQYCRAVTTIEANEAAASSDFLQKKKKKRKTKEKEREKEKEQNAMR